MPEGLRAVLVGEAEGVREEDNRFYFDDIRPGEHTLYVYGERGTVEKTEFVTDMAFDRIELAYMICLCVGTELTPVRGVVTDAGGKPVVGAVVAVTDLFIETVTDKSGVYYLKLPPGEWTITAVYGGITATGDIELTKPKVDSLAKPDVDSEVVDFRLE